jgi:hypothetical protein
MNNNELTEVKIEFYLPEENLEAMRLALSEVQAGIVGNYDNVFATTQVTGHWRPLEGAIPYLGKTGEMETAPELKMEINCKREFVSAAIRAIRKTHPYEEPLIRVIPIINDMFE